MEVEEGPRDGARRSDGGVITTGPAVEVESLVKRYGELVAVDGLSLRIPRGQILGLLGPNGSGKTTTINCILQLLSYDKGSIHLFGELMTPTAYGLKRRIVVANRVDDDRHALDVVQVALIGDAVQVDECRDVLTPTYSARYQGAGGEGLAIGLKATAPV